MSWAVLYHDCHLHEHDHRVVGPFDDADDARDFISRHQLFFPSDGGYAFATVISAEGQGGMTSPTDEYWGDEDEDDD